MSQLYKLTVKIPHDDIGFPKTQEILTRMSYTKRYWKAIVYPNSIEYILGPFSQVGIDNAKTAFRGAFKDATPEMQKHCSFDVEPHSA